MFPRLAREKVGVELAVGWCDLVCVCVCVCVCGVQLDD